MRTTQYILYWKILELRAVDSFNLMMEWPGTLTQIWRADLGAGRVALKRVIWTKKGL